MVTNLDSDYVEATLGSWGLGLKSRLMTAGWFAGAACVPVVFFFLLMELISSNRGSDVRFSVAIWFVWLFVVIPISAAALMGFIFGCRIVDPIRRTTPVRAALRGTLVAFLSYVLFIINYGLSVTALPGSYRTQSLSEAAALIAIVFFFGFVFVGWLVLIAGAFAGWLLYRASIRDPGRFLGVPGDSVAKVNVWIAVAIVLFLLICAGLLPVNNLWEPY